MSKNNSKKIKIKFIFILFFYRIPKMDKMVFDLDKRKNNAF